MNKGMKLEYDVAIVELQLAIDSLKVVYRQLLNLGLILNADRMAKDILEKETLHKKLIGWRDDL